jgi:hypothetical protein
MFFKERDEFFFKRHRSMVLFLIFDVFSDRVELRETDAERAIARLPSKKTTWNRSCLKEWAISFAPPGLTTLFFGRSPTAHAVGYYLAPLPGLNAMLFARSFDQERP